MHLNFNQMRCIILVIFLALWAPLQGSGQSNPVEEDKLGAWYMYFFQKKLGSGPWGIQGDYQFRNWNLGGDLEQLLLRTGVTYRPKNTDIMFTGGYAYINTGNPGEGGNSVVEHRTYQEALLPQRIGSRFFLTHRFRFEQRWLDNQDFRTRFRYNIFLNVTLNNAGMTPGTVYLALYNELFINGERSIGGGRSVELFDRNRFYSGLGYVWSTKLRSQLGWMRQTTDVWSKDQLQVSMHHNF